MTDPKEAFTRLRAIRGGHRGAVTKLVKEVNEILQDDSVAINVNRLEVLDQQLDGKTTTLKGLDQNILEVCELENLNEEIEESDLVTAKILECRTIIDSRRKQQTATTNGHHTENGAVNFPSTSNANSSNTVPVVKPKLPKLTLPRFKGDVTKWHTFWESFDSAIHSNTAIFCIDKFNYLKSLLDGPAARSIQGLNLTIANYDSAIALLQERFGKKQQIISAHMDELLKISSCSNVNDNLQSLRSVYDKISVHTRGLSSLGVSSKEYGSLLIPVIMSKLPNEIRIQIARMSTSEVWEIEELLKIIKTELEAREASERIKASEKGEGNTQVQGQGKPSKTGKNTASTFLSNQGENNVPRCLFCEERHFSASCSKIVEPEKRKEILRKKNRCFKCLKIGHHAFECKTTKTCRNCSKSHHQSICDQTDNRESKSHTPQRESKPEQSESVTTTTLRRKETVLLQTAKATAINEDGTKSTKVRILFDNGSQFKPQAIQDRDVAFEYVR